MKTLQPTASHRMMLSLAVGAVLAAGLGHQLLLNQATVAVSPAALPNIGAQPVTRVNPANTLPFSMREVVTFLSRTFQTEPAESGPEYAMFICADRYSGTGEEIMRIAVRSRGRHLWVTFTFRQFSTMHYIAEFIEAPLFNPIESEQLYALLYAPSKEPVWKDVGRFLVKAVMVEAVGGIEMSFEFAPSPV